MVDCEVVMPTVQRPAWYVFSEVILQTLICFDDTEERKQGIQKIIELRGMGDEKTQRGDNSVRVRKTPVINQNATTLLELIDWSDGVYQPPLTCGLPTFEIKRFLNEPMQVLQWPYHAQGIERCVKQVTEAASKVYSDEKREGFIRGQEASRRLMSKNESKQDLMKLVV